MPAGTFQQPPAPAAADGIAAQPAWAVHEARYPSEPGGDVPEGKAVHELLRPALDAGAHTGAAPWPRALRIHRVGASYSMASSSVCTMGRPGTIRRPGAGQVAMACLSLPGG